MIFNFLTFSLKCIKSNFSAKKCPTAPRGPKKALNFIGLTSFSGLRPPRCGKVHFAPKVGKVFRSYSKKSVFHKIHEVYKNFMFSNMSEPFVFPRKYLVFHKCHAPPGRPSPQKCIFGCKTAHFRFLDPKRAPLAKPLINIRFWARFWRPRGDFSHRDGNLGENHT